MGTPKNEPTNTRSLIVEARRVVNNDGQNYVVIPMVQHVIITRYSVANLQTPVQSWFRDLELMDEARLALRLQLFKFATFPSVVNQSDQDFDWIILIDAKLPMSQRLELEALTRQRPRTHLVNYDPRIKVWRGQWIREWLQCRHAPIATTLLDDDDALPKNYIERLRELMSGVFSLGSATGPRIFAYYNVTQWDLRFESSTPLGIMAPWHRRRYNNTRYPAACGLTLLVPNQHYDLSVLSIPHVNADLMLEPGFEAPNRDTKNGLRLLRAAAACAGENWREWSAETHFTSLDTLIAPSLMLNHSFNDQEHRLHERKVTPTPVTGPETFPDIALDWGAIAAYAGVGTRS